MSSKWIGCLHKGWVGTRWSPSEKPYISDPEDKSCNAERPEDDMWSHVNTLRNQPKKIGHLLSGELDYLRRPRGQDNS